jgi:hypothetical protein
MPKTQRGLTAYSVGAQPAKVEEVRVAVQLAPLGVALAATSTLYAAIPVPENATDLTFVPTSIDYSILFAGTNSTSNYWTLAVDAQNASCAYNQAVLAATDVSKAAVAFESNQIKTGITARAVATHAPGLKITLTKVSAGENITAGQIVVRGYFKHDLGS